MGKRRSLTELEAIRVSDKETRTRIPGVAVLVYLTLIVLAALALYNLVKYNAPDLWVWVTAASSALISTYILSFNSS